MTSSNLSDNTFKFNFSMSLAKDLTIDHDRNTLQKYHATDETQRLGPNGYPAFLFVGSAETIDHQKEIINLDAIIEVMPIMKRQGSLITGYHTNQNAGSWFDWYETTVKSDDGNEIRILILDVEVYDDFPSQKENLRRIKLPETHPDKIRGLSIGGKVLAKHRECDPDKCYNRISKIEGWEYALVDEPANPIALRIDEETFKIRNIRNPDNTKTEELSITQAETNSISEVSEIPNQAIKSKSNNAYVAFNGEGRAYDIRTGYFLSKSKLKEIDDSMILSDEEVKLIKEKQKNSNSDCKCGCGCNDKSKSKVNKMSDKDKKGYKKEEEDTEDYDDEQGEVPGEQDTGPDEYADEDEDSEKMESEEMEEEPETEEKMEDYPNGEMNGDEKMSEEMKAIAGLSQKLDKLLEALSIQKGEAPPETITDESGNVYELKKGKGKGSETEQEELTLEALAKKLETLEKKNTELEVYKEEYNKLRKGQSSELGKGFLPAQTTKDSDIDTENLNKIKNMSVQEKMDLIAKNKKSFIKNSGVAIQPRR